MNENQLNIETQHLRERERIAAEKIRERKAKRRKEDKGKYDYSENFTTTVQNGKDIDVIGVPYERRLVCGVLRLFDSHAIAKGVCWRGEE